MADTPDTLGSPTGDRYTMAEAARIKGVSYHTVSRAVRSGKLPAQRLGRMALIAAADLHGWRPMRERAPRKYRRAEPELEQLPHGPVLTGAADARRYTERLTLATEQLIEVASAESISRFGDWVALWLASSLNSLAAVVWRIDQAGPSATCYGQFGTVPEGVPDRLAAASARVLVRLAGEEQVVPLDRRTLRSLDVHGWASDIEQALLIPMRAGSNAFGCAIVMRGPPVRNIDEAEAAFALRLGSHAAFAIDHVEMRREDRTRFLAEAAVFDELPFQIVATDRQGTIVYANRTFAEIWGEEAQVRFVGRHFTHFLRTFRREWLNGVEVQLEDHPLSRASRGERVEETRVLVPETPGGPRVLALSARPTYDGKGEQTGAIFTAREVTGEIEGSGDGTGSPVAMLADARRRVELLAELSNEIAQRQDFDEVFDIVATRGCAVLDGEFSLVLTPAEANHLVIRATHNMSDRMVGRVMSRINFPSAILAMAERDLMYVSEDEAGVGGRELLLEGGGKVALLIPLVDGDEALGVLAVHYSDVNRLRQVDPELARAVGRQCGNAIHLRNVVIELESSRSRLLTTLDQLPQAVVILDAAHGEVVAMNREAEALWGPSAERIGQHASDLPVLDEQGDVVPAERHPFLRPLRTGRTEFGVPLMIRGAAGDLVDVIATVAPVRGTSDELRGAVALLHRREHFEPMDRAKDEFISVVAHELRNPLTSLRGNLQLLERRLGRVQSEAVQREIERVSGVIQQVDRIGDLVSRMLDVSRADLGKLTIDAGEADAVEITRSAIADVGSEIGRRRVTLVAPEALPVVWDHVRVQQILMNLLTNAVRYAPEGRIEVTVDVDGGDRVSISVRDHGPGVPPRLRRRLFRLYYRFDDGEETADGLAARQRGLGIGLYISARLAKAHGGELTVDDAEGGGAVFTLRLPRVVADSATSG